MRVIAAVLLFSSMFVYAADDGWPGLPPDCWSEPRMVHSQDSPTFWQDNTKIESLPGETLKDGETSPNKGYMFTVEGGRPAGKITIYSEKDHLIQINFSNLYGLSDVKWVNEKLIFMRPWWGRIAATDIIFDVEKEKIIYSEFLRDGTMAYQQYAESCPELGGCTCIEKKP